MGRPAYVDAPVPELSLRREHRLASQHEPRFARAFLRLTAGLLSPGTKRELLQGLRYLVAGRGTVDEAVGVVPWYNPAEPLSEKLWNALAGSAEAAYVATFEDAGQSEYKARGWPLRFQVEKAARDILVPTNPYSIAWIRERSARLVAETSLDQQELLRQIISAGFEDGMRPQAILEEIERVVGLTTREWQWVRNREGALREAGVGESTVSAAVSRYTAELLRKRAKRIARTETIEAYNQGLGDSWQLAQEEGHLEPTASKQWVEITASPRTCEICRGLGRQVVPLNQPFVSDVLGEVFRPPAHPHCLPGDTRVLAQGITATSERRYEGDLLVVCTASGKQLTCTPNHPILGHHGWVPANRLRLGDHVVSSARPDWITPGIVDHQKTKPPVVQQIANLALVESSALARRVPLTAHDFHGDGKGSKVAIIRPYHGLLREMGAAPAWLNANGQKDPAHRIAADAEGFGERLLTDPSAVFLDKVVAIDVQTFHGSVFNLETKTGAYVAGGLVTHNCRCGQILVTQDDPIDTSFADGEALAARNTLAGG